VLYGHDYVPAIMRNLSATGALIDAVVDAPIGAAVLLDLGQRQLAMARVRRVMGARLGLEFEDPLVDDGRGGLRTRRRVPHQLIRQAGLPTMAVTTRVGGVAAQPEQLREQLGLPSPARLAAAAPATPPPTAGGTVEQLAQRYLAMLADDPQRRDQDRAYIARHLEPSLGRLPAGALSPHRIAGWLAAQGREDVPTRVIERLRFIASQLLCLAVHGGGEDAAAGAPAALFDRRDLVDRIVGLDEVRRLGAAAQTSGNVQLKNVLCLLLLTGLRVRELLNLRWEELDLTARRIRLRGGADRRDVEMSPAVAAMIEALPRVADAIWVLPNPHTGKPYRSLQESWAATLRRADLVDLELDDLRRGIVDEDDAVSEETIVALFNPAAAAEPGAPGARLAA
jgi:integrase